MGEAPICSVVIPVWNGEKYLAEAVNSVLAQSRTDLEVIIVDDGSTDGTPAVIAQFGQIVRSLRQPNQGVSAARNAGIAAARGKYVAFLDADDVWLPNKLERQLRLFEDNPRLGTVGCGYRVTDKRLNPLSEYIPSHCSLTNLLLVESNGGHFSSSFVVPRHVLDDVGGFDPRLSTSADWDFVTRVALRYELAFVPEVQMLYRLHGSNMHRGIPRTEHDMELAFAKVFDGDHSCQVQRYRRRAYSNLYRMLSGSYWHSRDIRNAVRCSLLSLAWHPGNWPSVLRPVWRRRP
jgi:glycosyltransferase involved in cell wall biosynthesis